MIIPISKKRQRKVSFSGLSACFFYERAGARTPDNLIKSQVLYHLSYTPLFGFREKKSAQNRNRTSDTRIFSPLLYRLSYLGKVAGAGFEPATFGL